MMLAGLYPDLYPAQRGASLYFSQVWNAVRGTPVTRVRLITAAQHKAKAGSNLGLDTTGRISVRSAMHTARSGEMDSLS